MKSLKTLSNYRFISPQESVFVSLTHNPTWFRIGIRIEGVNLFGRDEGQDYRNANGGGRENIAGLENVERVAWVGFRTFFPKRRLVPT